MRRNQPRARHPEEIESLGFPVDLVNCSENACVVPADRLALLFVGKRQVAGLVGGGQRYGALDPFHDIERRAENGGVLFVPEHFGRYDGRVLDRRQHAELRLEIVRFEKTRRRLLANDESLAGGASVPLPLDVERVGLEGEPFRVLLDVTHRELAAVGETIAEERGQSLREPLGGFYRIRVNQCRSSGYASAETGTRLLSRGLT